MEIWERKQLDLKRNADRTSALRDILALEGGSRREQALQDFSAQAWGSPRIAGSPRRPCPPKHSPHQHRAQVRATETLDYVLFMHDSWKP